MTNLKLYYKKVCPFSQKVLRAIEDNNLKNIELREITEVEQYREELVNIGGKEQVPCLFIDEKPMYESDDIINYLLENAK